MAEYWKSAEKSKDVPWWHADLHTEFYPQFEDFLANYSKIPREEAYEHVIAVREKLWQRAQYPCTGIGSFMVSLITQTRHWPHVLSLLQNGATMLELGSYIGHDLRKAVHAGAPSANLHGSDYQDFWDLGYEMFADRPHFAASYARRNILEPGDFADLGGRIDVVWQALVLHLFPLDKQVAACKNMVGVSRGVGSVFVGCGVGMAVARPFSRPGAVEDPAQIPWGQSPDSFREMWARVQQETGTSWEVQAELRSLEEYDFDRSVLSWLGDDAGLLEYCVTRLE